MVTRLLVRLLGLAVSAVLTLGVCAHLGPALAARSLGGYVQAYDAASRGDTARADSIGSDLRRQWLDLEHSITSTVHALDVRLRSALPR